MMFGASRPRVDAYPCLILFTHSVCFHPGHALFFHYYAHLYGSTCKSFRRKKEVADDMRLAADAASGGDVTETGAGA